jgi:protein-tyrosine phosphatase
MKSEVYWIEVKLPGRLGIMARPRAGDWLCNEIAGWASDQIDVVVSLLEPTEIAELELSEEPRWCREQAIDLISFPIADRSVPASMSKAIQLSRFLAEKINQRKTVAVHCRAGIGRSAVIAGCVLVTLGTEPDLALTLISNARLNVPDTEEQRSWLQIFRDAPQGERGT